MIGIVNVCATSVVVFVAWMGLLCHQKEYIRLIKEVARLDNRFQKLGVKIQYERLKKAIRVQCVVRMLFLITAIGTHIAMCLNRHTYVDNTIDYIAFVINSSICMQVCTFGLLLRDRFAILNNILKEIKDSQSNGRGGYIKIVDNIVNNKSIGIDFYFMKMVMRMHFDLSNVVKRINNIFGASLLALFLVSFQTSLFGFYFNDCAASHFDLLQLPAAAQLTIVSMVFTLDAAYLFYICTTTCNEARKSGAIIYQFQRQDDLRQQIDMFSLQMIHTKVEFNAAGLLAINYASVFSMLGAFTMNLIILIQFSTEKQYALCLEVPLENYK
ncbi:putative gustatory receptor 28a [Agrilus planipennis]|uniref:Gustatory receptor n=1 Tax=Agrilus planipennis TaxID=224129 RepID=A0A1W4X503_AGRPL|nr:putative gustatory receptor 28a [Agrilus planipennis]